MPFPCLGIRPGYGLVRICVYGASSRGTQIDDSDDNAFAVCTRRRNLGIQSCLATKRNAPDNYLVTLQGKGSRRGARIII